MGDHYTIRERHVSQQQQCLRFSSHIFFLPYMEMHPNWLMDDCIMQYEEHNYKTPGDTHRVYGTAHSAKEDLTICRNESDASDGNFGMRR